MNGQRTEQLDRMMPSLDPLQRTEELDAVPVGTGTLRLADFVLENKLGEGGSATVHAAVHTPTGRRMALKTIHKEHGNDPKFVGRFEREVRAAASLVHPNICRVMGWGKENGQLLLAMELLEGESLAALLHRIGSLPPQVAGVLLDQLLDAVGTAHAAGILHRDVKPANLLVTTTGQLKLLDFGIAKRRDDIKVTETGHLVGTPAYMSPEHAAGEEIDTRSDLYSCGVVLYEMLVGQNPFEKLGTSTTLLRIVNEGITPIFEHAVTTPGALEAVFEQLSDRVRERRFPDAAAARAALAPYLSYVARAHPDVVAWFLQSPEERRQELDREMAVIEVLRAADLEKEGEASLPAASIALWRAVNLDPVNASLQDHFAEIAQRAGAKFTAPVEPQIKDAIEDAQAFVSAGAFKRAADLSRANGYLIPAVVFLRRYLREQPKDSHAARQLEVLVAGANPDAPKSVTERSGLRTLDIIAGVKTGGGIAFAPRAPRQSTPKRAGREEVAGATTIVKSVHAVAASMPQRVGAPMAAQEGGLGRFIVFGGAALLGLAGVVWFLKAFVFVEVIATQRMISDNAAQVGMAETHVAEKRRENLLLDARSLLGQEQWDEALLKTNRLLAEEGLPAALRAEALYIRGMSYRGLRDRFAARRAFIEYTSIAPTTDVHFAEVRTLIDLMSRDDAFELQR